MITIAVVLPTTRNKIGSRSLSELAEYYKMENNSESSQICKAAIACKAKAYALVHKVREVQNGNVVHKLHHVTLSLDFEDINDMARFMKTYTMIVS